MRKTQSRHGGFLGGSQKITNISFKMENCKIDKKEEII